ncbi:MULTISPECIES: hypothetical protein [Vibrio]|uniref:Uncharacterized protein n=1 Tax=Vibrio hyugaensis TaxID=1534743 RepID=A0ABQ5Y8U3_9VIBR|nr:MULTISPECIES: hypothetical protein [Vibrio]MCX2791208.1 hypothetical protein [Vibrio sp. Sgm 5]GLR07032.1 hypothetical protein GCM10007906_46200 [Vibrio hyugaensis]
MTEPAKDINSIYSSYNLTQHQYVETTEEESYLYVKSKWLVFQSKPTKGTGTGIKNKQAGLETEAI